MLDQSNQAESISPFQIEERFYFYVDSYETPLVVDPTDIHEPEVCELIKSHNDAEVFNDVHALLDHVANKAQVDHFLHDDSTSISIHNDEPPPYVSLPIVPRDSYFCGSVLPYP